MIAGFTLETRPIRMFNSLRCGYTAIMGEVLALCLVLAVGVFGLIGKFGNLPRRLGAGRTME